MTIEADLQMFNPSLWDVAELHLSVQQNSALARLQQVLVSSKIELAEALRLGQAKSWSSGDMRRFEREVLRSVQRHDVKASFEILTKVAQRHRVLTGIEAPYPRSVMPVKLERNPFHIEESKSTGPGSDREASLGNMDNLHRDLMARLKSRVADLVCSAPSPEENTDDARLYLALGIVSTVLHFHLLDESMIVSLVDSMAGGEDRRVPLSPGSNIWVLSLSWQGEQDAERRLFVPDIMSEALLLRVPKAQVERIFPNIIDSQQSTKIRRKRIMGTLRKDVREAFGNADLAYMLDIARRLAYLHLPAAVAAARCRKLTTHAPRPEVLFRILHIKGRSIEPQGLGAAGELIDDAEHDAGELEDETDIQPGWLHELRRAFHEAPSVIKELSTIRDRGTQPASRFAEFGLSLLAQPGPGGQPLARSTVRRYCLLVARRFGSRLGDSDPKTLPIDKLEDLYREALDDDWNDDSPGIEQQKLRRNKRSTITALARFHRFLDVGPLEELKDVLKNRGLVPVDANFISVDEYQNVLDHISGPDGPDDPHWRQTMRLVVMLAFRCGLRRREALYLNLNDFDPADHLHIRRNELRELKTSNAQRSIPLEVFLAPSELGELKEYISKLRRMSEKSTSQTLQLLFPASPKRPSIPINEVRMMRDIHRALRSTLNDSSLRLHHLRHSFATLVTAKLFSGSRSFLQRFFRHHPETLTWLAERDSFRKKLFGTQDITSLDLQAVALLLGHGDPETSVEHYIHSNDWFEAEEDSE
jgi:integrase